MSFLVDLLLDALGGDSGPQSERGFIVMFAAASAVLGTISFVLGRASAPFLCVAGSIVAGATGASLSALHFVRVESERRFAVCAFVGSVLGPLLVSIR